jgi:hypothetical protein
MKENVNGRRPSGVCKLAIAMLSAIAASPITYANPSNRTVLVPPTELPTLARQGGEAMFLRNTWDGRKLLYVEQRQDAQLAIFDVTDPAHVKGAGSAQLNAPGPFDFVGALGGRAELVRFRQGQGDAVLDLYHKVPMLKNVQELHAQTSTVLVDDSSSAKDFSVRDADGHIVEVKQVRQEITNVDTGTTFLLAEKGLYLIRRPALETVSEVYLARCDSAAGESGKE